MKAYKVISSKGGKTINSAVFRHRATADKLATSPIISVGTLMGIKTSVEVVKVSLLEWLFSI